MTHPDCIHGSDEGYTTQNPHKHNNKDQHRKCKTKNNPLSIIFLENAITNLEFTRYNLMGLIHYIQIKSKKKKNPAEPQFTLMEPPKMPSTTYILAAYKKKLEPSRI